MQIIYAAPFLLISLLCFIVFVAVPRLRRQVLAALVAPVAFGFCSLAGWVAFALVEHAFPRLYSSSGFLLAIEGMFFYCLPGALGAWLAVRVVQWLERKLRSTQAARDLAIRFVSSFIAGAVGFVVIAAIAEDVLPVGSDYPALITALVSAGVFATLTFVIIMLSQRPRIERSPRNL